MPYDKSLVIIKPNALKRKIVHEIISRFEHANLEIEAMQLFRPDRYKVAQHYGLSKQWRIHVGSKAMAKINELYDVEKVLGTTDALEFGTMIWNWSVNDLAEKKLLAIIFKGYNAIDRVSKVVGGTEPYSSPAGTIRGDFSSDTIIGANIEHRVLDNVVHRSFCTEEAKHEISTWFGEEYL